MDGIDFVDDVTARLAAARTHGYHAGSQDAAEPMALGATALLAAGRTEAAGPLLAWLADHQASDGSVGIDAADAAPGWPTGWAVIAWQFARRALAGDSQYRAASDRAIRWIESVQGQQLERLGPGGHDTMLKGWSWVLGTHAWLEPTAINVLALKQAGRGDGPRAREAVRLLIDRMLPGGGCNYGNTVVFGQELLAHVQPTGLCLLALAGEAQSDARIARSIEYLHRVLSERTATASLAYALLGLAAHGRLPPQSTDWLNAAARRTLARDPGSYKLALLALAALGDRSALLPSTLQAPLP